MAFLDYSPSAKSWHRRLAARASEIGDLEALAMATGNLFGQVLNARDREELRRLRPELLALEIDDLSQLLERTPHLITPRPSPRRSPGWPSVIRPNGLRASARQSTTAQDQTLPVA